MAYPGPASRTAVSPSQKLASPCIVGSGRAFTWMVKVLEYAGSASRQGSEENNRHWTWSPLKGSSSVKTKKLPDCSRLPLTSHSHTGLFPWCSGSRRKVTGSPAQTLVAVASIWAFTMTVSVAGMELKSARFCKMAGWLEKSSRMEVTPLREER